MSIVARDKHGDLTKKRRADGPPLHWGSTRRCAAVRNAWTKGFA
jgi:hypothetical protein